MFNIRKQIIRSAIKHLGFTLIEILIALFIFTIIAMLSTSVLHTVIKASEGTENSAERLRNLQMALIMMSREVEQAIDRPITNSIGKEEVAFIGTPRGFTFTHLGLENPLARITQSALVRTGYYWDKEKLLRLVWPSVDQAPKAKANSRELLAGVSYARFEYLDGEGRFHEQWPLESEIKRTLPRAVKMDLTLAKWGKISQTYVIIADPVKPKPPMPEVQQQEKENPENYQMPHPERPDGAEDKKVEGDDDQPDPDDDE